MTFFSTSKHILKLVYVPGHVEGKHRISKLLYRLENMILLNTVACLSISIIGKGPSF